MFGVVYLLRPSFFWEGEGVGGLKLYESCMTVLINRTFLNQNIVTEGEEGVQKIHVFDGHHK